MQKPTPMQIQVFQVEWLTPGWIIAMRPDFTCEATRFDTPRGDSPLFAQNVLAKLEAIRLSPGPTGVFLSQDDCALVTEHFPEAFYRTKK